MSWERLDLSTLEPDLGKLIAAATDPNSRLTPAAIRETGLALLLRAKSLPALFVRDDDAPSRSSWIGTRYVAEKGQVEVSFWKDEADALFQAEWEGKTLRSLLLQIGERIWTSDPVQLRGWDYDPHRMLEAVDTPQDLKNWAVRADEVVAAWDRDNHLKNGWHCAVCGWQNRAEETMCAVCFFPQHPVTINPRAEWKERAVVPPPPFDEPVETGKPGEAVELPLPPEAQAMLRDAVARPAAVEVDPVVESKITPRRCWRCQAELKSDAHLCSRCGADQQVPPPPDKIARPTNLPE